MRLIDADSLIGELHNTYLYDSDARSVIYRKIDEQPTVDAVPVVHGHWIWSDDLCEYCCSRCGHTDDYGIHPDIEYCPYCGAKMDEVME